MLKIHIRFVSYVDLTRERALTINPPDLVKRDIYIEYVRVYFRCMPLPESEIILCSADMSILLQNLPLISYNIRTGIYTRYWMK